jgi:hypothetical protein
MKVCGQEIKIVGRFLRVARLDADKYQFLEDDPEPLLEGLRNLGVRIDLFTFMQRLPAATPKYKYPMEWDNLATIELSTFDDWWTKQLGFKARNKAKQAEKKGVVIREVPFSDKLVQGIWEIYNECPIRQGRRFPHYGKSLETVYREEATYLDSSVFIGAFLGERLIGRPHEYRLVDPAEGQGSHKRSGRSCRPGMYIEKHFLSRVFEFLLRPKAAGQSQRLQRAQRFPAH